MINLNEISLIKHDKPAQVYENKHGQALPQDQNQVTTQRDRWKLTFTKKEMTIFPDPKGSQNSRNSFVSAVWSCLSMETGTK